MAGEWRVTTIGEIIKLGGGSIKTGPFGTALKAHEYSTSGVPLISVREVGYGALCIDEKTPCVPHEVVERLPEYFLEEGDIVFGRKGAVDRSALVKREQAGWFLGSDGIRLRLPRNVDARFVAYHLRSPETRAWLMQHATGTTMASLNQSIVERVPIVLPELPIQRAIAHILGTLDDKIELNRRMNETLEAMARALFKSWFVDFDPVRAKAEGRDPGLPAEIADLFPEGFEESELGPIPRGWKNTSFLDVADLLSGGTPSTSVAEYWGGNIPWVSAKDVGNAHGTFILETEKTITPLGVENSSTKVLPQYTTIVTARGSVGNYCLLGREMAMNQTNYGLKAKEGIGDYFVFFSLAKLVEHLKQQAYGTIFDTVTTKTFRDTIIVRPPESLLSAFDNMVKPLMMQVLNNERESRTLAALRDTLLPKLISGELRVKDAEKFA
jgi:type I restriction enzyme S subunit